MQKMNKWSRERIMEIIQSEQHIDKKEANYESYGAI